MSLSLQSRSLGDIAVVTCVGRIVEGSDATALEAYVKELLPVQPHILLDLRDVSFIDSAGLGILVRLLTRARAAHGDLKLCTVSPHLREVLRSTKLHTILAAYDTEVDAVAAFCAPTDSAEAPRVARHRYRVRRPITGRPGLSTRSAQTGRLWSHDNDEPGRRANPDSRDTAESPSHWFGDTFPAHERGIRPRPGRGVARTLFDRGPRRNGPAGARSSRRRDEE